MDEELATPQQQGLATQAVVQIKAITRQAVVDRTMSMQQHRALMVPLSTHPTVPITPQAAAQCSTCVSTRLSQHLHAANCTMSRHALKEKLSWQASGRRMSGTVLQFTRPTHARSWTQTVKQHHDTQGSPAVAAGWQE
jgi:hypothetical protein